MQRAFVMALSKCGVVSAAARSVGRTARSAYQLRKRAGAEGFAAAWDMALEMGVDEAEGRAIAGLRDGERVPVLYRGRIVGWRIRHNDSLAIAALRAVDLRQRREEAAAARAAAAEAERLNAERWAAYDAEIIAEPAALRRIREAEARDIAAFHKSVRERSREHLPRVTIL